MENNNVTPQEENQEKEKDCAPCGLALREKENLNAFGEEKKSAMPRYLYYSQFFNSIMLGFILVVLLVLTIQSFFFYQDIKDFISSNLVKLSNTLTSVENAGKALEQSAKAVQHVSEAQNKLLTDEKTQEGIAVLLRQADDVARGVKKINVILDNVQRETLPSVNTTIKTTDKTIAQAGATLAQTERSIFQITEKGLLVLDSSNASIRALEAILAQPNLKVIVDNLAATSGQSIETVKQLNISAEEINKALPELLAKINQIGNNTDLSGKEITAFLASLNKPTSKKTKVFRFILETVIKSSPVLLKR